MNEVPFKIVVCYRYSIYEGWTTADRPGYPNRDEAYFIQIGDKFFMVGYVDDPHYMNHD